MNGQDMSLYEGDLHDFETTRRSNHKRVTGITIAYLGVLAAVATGLSGYVGFQVGREIGKREENSRCVHALSNQGTFYSEISSRVDSEQAEDLKNMASVMRYAQNLIERK